MSDPPASPNPPEFDSENNKSPKEQDSTLGDDINPGDLAPVGA